MSAAAVGALCRHHDERRDATAAPADATEEGFVVVGGSGGGNKSAKLRSLPLFISWPVYGLTTSPSPTSANSHRWRDRSAADSLTRLSLVLFNINRTGWVTQLKTLYAEVFCIEVKLFLWKKSHTLCYTWTVALLRNVSRRDFVTI